MKNTEMTTLLTTVLQKVEGIEGKFKEVMKPDEFPASESGPKFTGDMQMMHAGNNQLVPVIGYSEIVIQEREQAAYNKGLAYGVAITWLLAFTLMMKIFR